MKYYEYLVGYRVGGNGCDYTWNDLPNGWYRDNTPSPGSIAVWGSYANGDVSWSFGKNGHVGLVYSVNGNTIYTVETNTGGSQEAKFKERNASYVTTYIHPDFLASSIEVDTRYPQFYAYTFSTGNVDCYNSINGSRAGSVYPGDKCLVQEVYTNGWCKFKCPWPDENNMKTVYAPLNIFIYNTSIAHSEHILLNGTQGYKKNNMAEGFEWLDARTYALRVSRVGELTQVIAWKDGIGNHLTWIRHTGDYIEGVDVGKDFYAYIINENQWRLVTNDFDNVSLRKQVSNESQIWHFVYKGNGYYKIYNCADGKALDVEGALNIHETNVQVYPTHDTPAQLWMICGRWNGAITLEPKCSDYCVLDVYNDGHDEGANIQIFTYHGGTPQKFRIWTDLQFTIWYEANGGSNAPTSQSGLKYLSTATVTKATPTAPSYTITYNANGGSVSTSTKKVSSTFNSWNTKKDGTGTKYASGANFEIHGDTVLYARWNAAQVGSLPTPTRSGYTFDGWYTAASGGTKVTSTSTITGNTTLYAHWNAPSSYTISYNANGGTGAPNSHIKPHGLTVSIASAIPTRFGYTFLGWATSSSATSATHYPASDYTTDADITLYAVWEPAANISSSVTSSSYSASIPFVGSCQYFVFTPSFSGKVQFESTGSGNPQLYLYDASGNQIASDDNDGNGNNFRLLHSVTAGTKYYVKIKYYSSGTGTVNFTVKRAYTITFNLNGGSGAPSTQTKLHGETLTLSSDRPTRTGYSFQGWGTSSNSANAAYFPGDSFTINADTTLYARWQLNLYTVTYDANGGTNPPCTQGKDHGIPLTLGSEYPIRLGYTFRGWATSRTATSADYYPGSSYTTDSDITLYAVWQANLSISANVTSSSNSASVAFVGGCQYFTFTPSFSGKVQFESIGSGDPQIYLYDSNGNELTHDDDSGDDHNFKLNYSVTSGTKYYAKIKYYSSGTGTVSFTVKRAYDITYNANGGSGAPDSQIKTHGTALTLSSATPTRSGYIFRGWATSSSATAAAYQPGSSFTSNANTTLYAVWGTECDNGHNYHYIATSYPTTSATGTLTGTCIRCNDTVSVTLPKLNTTDYTYSVREEPTCTTGGLARYTWKITTYGPVCFDVVIIAIGHNYSYKATKAPTASTTGTLTGTCTRCSETYTVTLPKLDTANYTYKVTKAATCTATGTGRYTWKTTTYGSFYFDVSIAATGHSYSYAVTKAPTTSATGTLTGTCSKCSGTTTVTLPKLDTTNYTYKVTQAATCTAAGTGRYTWKTTTYGSFYFDVTIAATGHSYSYAVTKAPTTSATGTLTGSCSKCSGTSTVTLPKLDTTNYTYKVTKAATCTATGTGRYTWKTTTYGSFYFDVSIAATGHSYSYAVTKAPTTSATGTLTGTCSKCNGTTTVTLPKLDTTNYTYKVTQAATCTAAGTGRYTWKTTTYGSFYFDVSIAATGHSYSSVVTAPTCTQKGYTTHTCHCGDSFVDSYVNALGHNMGTWTVVTAATCTKSGTERRDCSRCDHYETRNISATGHSYEPHVTEPTCTEDGYTQYICTACGNSYTSDYTAATGHDHKARVTSPTCTKQGYTTYTCHCGDSYVSDYTNALGHNMGDWTTTVKATCTKNGKQVRECSRCDHSENRTTEALGHDWDDGVVTVEPTEDSEGEMTYTCVRCSLTRTEAIPALDHEHRYDSVVTAPTCTEKGYTTHTCRCGDSFVDSYVDALGHDMGQWFTVTAATCTADGMEQRNCSRCDYYENRLIGATGHSYDSVVTAPTCTKKGFTTHTCHCGDSYIDSYTNSLGHSFTNYVSDGNATCTQDGTKTAVCDRCDATDTKIDVGSAHGHDFSNWTVVVNPTPTSDGLESRYCYHCGYEEQRAIPKIENPFTDVPMSSFYYDPVLWAVENGITNGATATTFNPNGVCLRAHVVTFLHRAAGSPASGASRNPFTDVKTSDFFYAPVLWAVEKGITNGVSATTFGSYDVCNRAAVVTFLWRAAGSPEPESTSHPFTDVKPTDFYYKPVLWAVENGITNGVDPTHFGPATPCNRAQVVTFLYRAYN